MRSVLKPIFLLILCALLFCGWFFLARFLTSPLAGATLLAEVLINSLCLLASSLLTAATIALILFLYLGKR